MKFNPLFLLVLLISFQGISQNDNYYNQYYKNKKIIVIMFDGFGETYYHSTPLPALNSIQKNGFYKKVSALMPTVTNCNNASICCGEFPDKTGITGNYVLDEHDAPIYMESNQLVMAPTIFEKLQKYGVKSALFSSKKKSTTLLNKGVEFAVSPETADSTWIKNIGKTPPIYSHQVNYWTMEAALYTLKNRKDISCLYIHTTDYPMHTWAPEDSMSKKHIQTIDDYIQKIMLAEPEALIFLTADHDVNHKEYCIDIDKSLKKQGVEVKAAISAEKDKYLKHHRGFGGTSYVYLKNQSDEKTVIESLLKIQGVKTVLTKKEACEKYHLLPSRTGDIVVFSDSLSVFGDLENTDREHLPATYRTHGSEYELPVPLFIHNAPKRPSSNFYLFNKDLLSWLFLDPNQVK